MSDLFGPPPPAPPPPKHARHRRPPPDAAPAPAPAASAQPDPPPAPAAPEIDRRLMPLYGLKTLHDGRQVDSGSRDWILECLAREIMAVDSSAEREARMLWFDAGRQIDVRMRMAAIEAATRKAQS